MPMSGYRQMRPDGVFRHVLNCSAAVHQTLVLALDNHFGGQCRDLADPCDHPGAEIASNDADELKISWYMNHQQEK